MHLSNKSVQPNCKTPTLSSMVDLPEVLETKTNIVPAYKYQLHSYRSYKPLQYCTNAHCYYQINVDECYNGYMTGGGTTFRSFITEVESEYTSDIVPISMAVRIKLSCSIKDHLNGTYTVCCVIPSCIPVLVVQLTLHVEYIIFAAFDVRCNTNSNNRLILTNTVNISTYFGSLSNCPKSLLDSEKRNTSTKSKNKCLNLKYNKKYGSWIKLSPQSEWKWMAEKCVMDLLPVPRIQHCFKSRYKNNFLIVGDSHLRYTYVYLLELLDSLPPGMQPKFQHDFYLNNKQFIWAPYVSDVLKTMKDVLSNKTSLLPKFIVLSGGAWDLRYEGFSFFIQNALKFVSYMKQPEIRRALRNVSIIWMGLVAYPDISPPRLTTLNYRNNGAIAALNAWVEIELEQLGITYVDPLPMTLPMQDHPVCVAHYICSRKSENNTSVPQTFGLIGIHVAHLMLQELCL